MVLGTRSAAKFEQVPSTSSQPKIQRKIQKIAEILSPETLLFLMYEVHTPPLSLGQLKPRPPSSSSLDQLSGSQFIIFWHKLPRPILLSLNHPPATPTQHHHQHNLNVPPPTTPNSSTSKHIPPTGMISPFNEFNYQHLRRLFFCMLQECVKSM